MCGAVVRGRWDADGCHGGAPDISRAEQQEGKSEYLQCYIKAAAFQNQPPRRCCGVAGGVERCGGEPCAKGSPARGGGSPGAFAKGFSYDSAPSQSISPDRGSSARGSIPTLPSPACSPAGGCPAQRAQWQPGGPGGHGHLRRRWPRKQRGCAERPSPGGVGSCPPQRRTRPMGVRAVSGPSTLQCPQPGPEAASHQHPGLLLRGGDPSHVWGSWLVAKFGLRGSSRLRAPRMPVGSRAPQH